MNWVDLLAILPYFLSLVLAEVITESSARGSEEVNRVGKFLKLLKIIRITRSVRIFKTSGGAGGPGLHLHCQEERVRPAAGLPHSRSFLFLLRHLPG